MEHVKAEADFFLQIFPSALHHPKFYLVLHKSPLLMNLAMHFFQRLQARPGYIFRDRKLA